MATESKVYIIGTPIGNLEDISERAKNSLLKVDIIYAEDTRSALKLLNYLEIKKPIKSCHKDNEYLILDTFLSDINNGKILAVMSEAGMPAISDPGAIIIKKLIDEKIKFEIVSSPTALIHGLIASGFAGEDFYFYGFLPHKNSEKTAIINKIKKIRSVIILYESPHRLKDTLEELLQHFTPPIAVCRELTKMYEETIFINALEDISKVTIKGEFVVVLNNKLAQNEPDENENLTYFKDTAKRLLDEKIAPQDILKVLKILGAKRNIAYDIIESIKNV